MSDDRRRPDPNLELIIQKISRVETGMDKQAASIDASMQRLTDAMLKLVVIEEKQAADRQTLQHALTAIVKAEERSTVMFERLTGKLEQVEHRTDVLEQAAPMAAQTNKWVLTALWASASAAALFVAKKVGLV